MEYADARRNLRPAGFDTFRRFLRARLLQIAFILAVGLALRTVLVINAPPANGDAKSRYIVTAVNVLDGHGFSTSAQAPYIPGEAIVPAYPLLIAATYAVFGRHEMAVRLLQVLIDLVTCLLVAFVSFNIAPAAKKDLTAIFALIIYGIFSWFTLVWTSDLLTETFTLFLTMLVVVLGALAMRAERKNSLWFGAGIVTGVALLTRPDSLLLAAAVLLLLLGRLMKERSTAGLRNVLSFSLAVPLVLSPWIARNYVTLGKFQPLASEYGFARPAYMPIGYVRWLRTWITDETYFSNVFPPAFDLGGAYLDPNQLPGSAFDSVAERQQVLGLIDRYNQTRRFTPAIGDEFGAIAKVRMWRSPVRFFITLPVHRAASMWFTGFAVRQPTNHDGLFKFLPAFSSFTLLVFRILSVLPIIVGGALGLALLSRRSPLLVLLLLIVLVRTLYMAYSYAPETRYMVEAYPPMIAGCGATAAALWLRLKRVFGGKLEIA